MYMVRKGLPCKRPPTTTSNNKNVALQWATIN